ncbi:hypothetical protein N0V88_003945 [Collariella sp. IMI 366227]|nr:hypothetical protein N0V88_003945 [Collariella sp. IMI 366227]
MENFRSNWGHRCPRTDGDVSALFSHRAMNRRTAGAESKEKEQTNAEVTQKEVLSQPIVRPEASFRDWRPSIVLGTPLCLDGEDLSAIEIADRKVAQTRLWMEHYQEVPDFAQMHQDAVRERGQLDETVKDNIKPRSALKSVQTKAIQHRIDHLNRILQGSQFPPERTNIEAAITGYESGAIPYSESYTVIWSGRIVDTCPDYDSFTANRAAHLDRYAAEHGPGWLWYEPPLSDSDSTVRGPSIQVNKALCLENQAEWRRRSDNTGHYRIQMGFRRRKRLVARDANPYNHAPKLAPNREFFEIPSTSTPDPDGPRIFWDTLLDSGATFPCLFAPDLQLIGVDPRTYAAQTSRSVSTADGVIDSVMYELDVGVYDGQGGTLATLPQPAPSSSPLTLGYDDNDPPMLGCTTPVVVLRGEAPHIMPANSRAAPDRLSGMLPFQVCYASSAPGQFKLWLGEQRCEVLGADRFPGQMTWGEAKGVVRPGGEAEEEGYRRERAERRGQPSRISKNRLLPAKRIVFEHDFADGSGRVLREEEGQETGHVLEVVGSELSQLEEELVGVWRRRQAAQRGVQQRWPKEVRNGVNKASVRKSARKVRTE